MADQQGRCGNVALCQAAVSNRLVTVPDGAPFTCAACGEPLQPSGAAPGGGGRRVVSLAVQVVAVLLGGGAVAWHFSGGGEGAVTAASAAPEKPPVPSAPTRLVTPSALANPAPLQPPTMLMAAPQATQAPAAPRAIAEPAAVAAPAAAPAARPAVAPAPAAPSTAGAPATVLLRLAGSDVMAGKLMQRLTSSYLAILGDTGITSSAGSGAGPGDGSIELSGMQAGQREMIRITPSSSASGFAALLRGSAEMVMSTRKITAAETERLTLVGDLTSGANEHVIAVQGVAAIVSPVNRIPSLTAAQARAILAGRIADWSEVGGTPGQIRVYVVDNAGGTLDAPQDVILAAAGSALAATPSAVQVASEQAVAAKVAADRDGIGFVTMGSSGSTRVLPIAEAGGAPVAPTDLAISTEGYPFSRRLYLYVGADANSVFVRRFLEYVTSASGQALVETAGFVPLTVKTAAAPVPDMAPDRFRQLVAGTTRVSVDFRFQPGSTDLDSRGARDLERVVTYLRTQRVAPGRVILAAFADNSGAPAVNQAVSSRRADAVAAALGRAGFTPGKVVAFGAELPVADNATAEGRERNRRVELYLAP